VIGQDKGLIKGKKHVHDSPQHLAAKVWAVALESFHRMEHQCVKNRDELLASFLVAILLGSIASI
jgi:hypothetical protein